MQESENEIERLPDTSQSGGNQLFHYICETCESAKRPLSNKRASRRLVSEGTK